MSAQTIQTTIRNSTAEAIQKAFGKKPKDKLKLAFPPDVNLGDFTIECFSLAKQFKKNPAEISKTVALEIKPNSIIQKVTAVGPYINFKIYSEYLFAVSAQIVQTNKPQRIMVEYLSPNTNKPLHLGHLRNGALGMAVSNLYQALGHTVIRANLINDRGVHICKSMLAWQKWADMATPESEKIKGDHFVGKWYVRYTKEAEKNPDLEKEIQAMLLSWEQGDKKVLKLWKMMNAWVYKGFEETYKKFGLKFDVFYYESKTYKLGKDIVFQGLQKKVFYKDKKGAVVFDLPEKEFGRDKDGSLKKALVLRTDSTSVYLTQDLGTAQLKADEHKLNRSIYAVGQEQEYHFKSLFKILQKLGYPWAGGLHHLSYAMVYLPEGKMKSREGKVVDADDLILEMTKLAEQEIKKRDYGHKLTDSIIKKRACKIGIAAVKFFLLRVNPKQDIRFNPKESISFDGFTGPYCQYAYARSAGILSKAKKSDLNKNADFSLLGNQEERLLAQKLIQFPEKVQASADQYNPSHLAVHIYETSKAFNQFYNKHKVLTADSQDLIKARLSLTASVKNVLQKGLDLLGIEVMEEM